MNVEMMGVEFVKLAIAKTDYAVPHINDNDREPSWDGDIEVYKNAGDIHSKSDLIYKVPVQVKGHKENHLKKKSIQYSIDMSDLKNYLSIGGTTFFVVYIHEDGEHNQIYYINLLPYELKRIISKYGHQKSKRMTLTALPKAKTEIADIFLFVAMHMKKQRAAITCDPISMEDLIKSGQVKSFSFGYTRVPTPNNETDPIEYLFDHETYIYAELPFGLELPVKHLYQIDSTETTRECPISINGKVFYNEYEIEQRKDSITIKLGKSTKIFTQRDSDKHNFTFKLTGTLEERITDEEFIICAIEARQFNVGEIIFPLTPTKEEEIETFKISERKNHLTWLKTIKTLLTKLGVSDDLNCDSISDEDDFMLTTLAYSILQNQFVEWEFNDDHFPEITIANLKIKLCVLQHETEKNLCRLFPYSDAPLGYRVTCSSGKTLDISYHLLLKRDSMIECCNIDFVHMIKQIQSYPITEEVSGTLIWFLLELLWAYDQSEVKRQDILDVAIDFSIWLKSSDRFTPQYLLDLNYCQAIARSRKQSIETTKILHSIIESAPKQKDVYVGAYLLLGDFESAQNHYDNMSKEEKETFNTYPISNFFPENFNK